MKLSVVIPCFNEETVLPRTLSALKEYLPVEIESEIILVDNGSSDRSVDIAEEYKIIVLTNESRTVAGVRNAGVKAANGDVLIFIDADVEVTEAWGARLPDALNGLDMKDILGSHCSVPSSSGYLAKYWYKAIEMNRSSHVGTGHMMLHRKTFEDLCGFNESLATGEDYDFCNRAKIKGGSIVEDSQLVVFHNGYPDTLVEFSKRELWHGIGDWQSLGSIKTSRVLQFACLYAFTCIAALSIIGFTPVVGLIMLAVMQGMLLLIAVKKFGAFDGIIGVFFRTMIFNVYFMARFLSFIGAFSMNRKEL